MQLTHIYIFNICTMFVNMGNRVGCRAPSNVSRRIYHILLCKVIAKGNLLPLWWCSRYACKWILVAEYLRQQLYLIRPVVTAFCLYGSTQSNPNIIYYYISSEKRKTKKKRYPIPYPYAVHMSACAWICLLVDVEVYNIPGFAFTSMFVYGRV